MAEELRHGYQMLHLLLSEDWTHVSGGVSGEQMVEEILSMTTGSHVLDAFNLDYDSFIDNIVFAACIDRVGKYQLTMQKICAYKPMADSMPPMLREEAFHLAAGVVPMRRWAQKAAAATCSSPCEMMQHALNKWVPRGLEMFGDERGGDTNVKFGFKDMKNGEAQAQYYEELKKMIRDVNTRFLRARFPEYGPEQAEAVLDELERTRDVHRGVHFSDLLRVPDARFFRRKGETRVPDDRRRRRDVHRRGRLPALPGEEPERRLRREPRHAAVRRHAARGRRRARRRVEQAVKAMPKLKRVGGTCPCSKGVRWVMEDADGDRDDGGGAVDPLRSGRCRPHGAASRWPALRPTRVSLRALGRPLDSREGPLPFFLRPASGDSPMRHAAPRASSSPCCAPPAPPSRARSCPRLRARRTRRARWSW